MKNRKIWFVLFVIALWLCTLWYSVLRTDSKDLMWIYNWFLDLTLSIDDEIRDNSVRCWAFQVAWNDFVEDINATTQSKVFDWLSKRGFDLDQMAQGNTYYNKFWLFTLDLKSEIEKEVKDKFDENINLKFLSNWSIVPQSSDYYEWKKEKKYGIYSKFNRLINLKNSFEKLDDWSFANVYDDVRYFGVNCDSNKKYDNVRVLYYNSDVDFAISIKTWGWDEIILSRWTRWKTFMVTYNLILSKERGYIGGHDFTKYDCLKIPEFNLKFEKEIYKLKDQKLLGTGGKIYRVGIAEQDVEIKLDRSSWDKKGKNLIDSLQLWDRYHYFDFDEPFMIFVKEYGKDLPYFAAQVSDVKLFQ